MWATLLLQACSLAAAQTTLPSGATVQLGAPVMVGSRWSAPVFSPDGKTLATACNDDNSVVFWDMASGQQRRRLIVGADRPWGIAFAPDGKTFYSYVGDVIREWDVATFKERRRFPGLDLRALAISPDGNWLAVSGGGRVLLWDRHTGKPVRMIQIATQRTIHFSPDSKLLASTDKSNIYMVEISSGKELLRLDLPANAVRKGLADGVSPYFVSVAFVAA